MVDGLERVPHPVASARRIHLVGPSGSGKSTIARLTATNRHWPAYHLDERAHVAGGGSPTRSAEELALLVEEMRQDEDWVSEGVDLSWTAPILAMASVIIWLADSAWRDTAARIVRRFSRAAAAEAGRQPGLKKVSRFGDYARRLRELIGALVAARRYASSSDRSAGAETRAAMADALAPFDDKVIRIDGREARAAIIEQLTMRG